MSKINVIIFFLVTIVGSTIATTHKCNFVKNTVYNYSCEIDQVEKVSATDLFNVDSHLPNKTNDHVKMVTFTRSSVGSVPTEIFKAFPNLEILDLIDCKVSTWSRDYLKNARKLKKLWLDKNEIAELADNSFMGSAGSLEVLILRENKITKLADKTFAALVSLKNLDLEENLLTSISNEIFAPLKKVREINLRGNKIAKIGGNAFKFNIDLQFLNLAVNEIETFGDHLFKDLANLTIVHLHKNKVTKIPDQVFKGCEKLMEIKLDDNELMEIPVDTFATNKRLKMIDIMNNKLETFDGKSLPTDFEILYLDEDVKTTNVAEKIEIFRREKILENVWTEDNSTTTTAKE